MPYEVLMPSMGYDCLNEDVTFYIREGDTVPDNGACPIGGKFVEVPLKEVVENKRVLIFTLPGAFTPTCSTYQLPEFDEKYDEIKAAGELDEIYCMAVNDSFVMNAWAEQLGIKNVKMLPDGNSSFTKRLRLDVGMNDLGFGTRCKRTALLFDNGVLKKRWIEDPSSPEDPDPYKYSTPLRVAAFFGVSVKQLATYRNVENLDEEGLDALTE